MGASGIMLIIQRTITVALFRFIRFILMLIQSVVWYFDGTTQQSNEAFQPNNFDRCVRIINVKIHHKFDISTTIALTDFIYSHNRFENPQYIIENDHITLVTLTPEYAIFGEAREKGMELWRSEYSSFIRNAQLEYCDKLLLVPLYAFNIMANQIGDPKGELVFLLNVGRCGSTLFTQIMECSGQCIAISEPEAPNILTLRYREKGHSEEMTTLTRSSIRWVCRPSKRFQPMAYVVKLNGLATTTFLQTLKEIYPSSCYIFIYREMMTVTKSIYRSAKELPAIYMAILLGQIHESLGESCITMAGFDGKQMRYRFPDGLSWGLVLHVCMSKAYLDLYQEGRLNIRAVRYEDLIADPTFAIRAILKHCKLPESLVNDALKGMEKDSQRNTPVSRRILAQHRAPDISAKGRQMINELARRSGVPGIGEDSLLPGTITCKPQNL